MIADPQGNAPITHSQSHLNLLNHHFPAHENTPVQVLADPLPQDLEEDPIMELLTPSIVRNALRSFGPKKAAGPDGLRPNVLRSLGWEAIGLLTEIYRESISTATIPRPFLHMSVIFIPKDKPDKSSPKSFRPITLASFLLKGLERIVQWHFNETILQNPLSNQHAYTKGRSCDSALSEVVNKMERGMIKKEHTLLVSLDCSGAFDNLSYDSSVQALMAAGVSPRITKWYRSLLANRKVDSEMYGQTRTIFPTRGNPQGGVLSPLIWNLAINNLLTKFRAEQTVNDLGRCCIKAAGYADDVLLMGQGDDPIRLVGDMQRAINRAVRWARQCGLAYNPQKTECLFKHPGRKTREDFNYPDLTINHTPLPYTDTLKYLGLTLDKSLLWNDHIKDKCAKAKRLFHLAKRAIGKEWGLTPDRIMWIHKAIIRPQVSYGSVVWAHKIKKHHAKSLASVQRQPLMSLAHSMRSTPTAGMEAILGIPPLDLHCQELALRAAHRLHLSQGWKDEGDVRAHRDFHLHDLKAILPPATVHPSLSLESIGSRDNHAPSPPSLTPPWRSIPTDPKMAIGPGTAGALPLMTTSSMNKAFPLIPTPTSSLQS